MSFFLLSQGYALTLSVRLRSSVSDLNLLCAPFLIEMVYCSAEFFKDRTDVQCLHRWQKVLNPELIKGPWSKEVHFFIASNCCIVCL